MFKRRENHLRAGQRSGIDSPGSFKEKKITRSKSPSTVLSSALVFFVVVYAAQRSPESFVELEHLSKQDQRILTDEEVADNSLQIQKWRQQYSGACSDDLRMNKRRRRLEIFHPPTSLLKQTFLNNVIEPCYHVFVDLGANIGDTLGHVIDAGLPFCTISGRKEFHPKFVTDHGTVRDFYTLGRWNPMSEWMYGYLCNMTAQNLYPEHFCVYSFEGNPMFTERLQRLEYRTMATIPRPVRRIHFFTESVVSHTSGPATLFLDTWGEKSNFDGSSLLNNMQRLDQVRETNQGRVKEAKVMGFTLSQILNMTVAPSSLSTIFIKMDIEGVEYHVINEAAESLCNLARQSLLVALLVERHGRMKDTEDSKRYYRETIGKLQRCGVQLTHGDGG